ncbi:helix-turn-helix domain-containing protein [Labilibaculum sp. A4]|uniref:helix-turn-helix domain-containing protein n=1 Tax=Labilibaculum euxinus TaxID=2686357 RepID=UPI000F626C2E|nr:helix-turn-helix transcriptional regulator [Labilibaculum euxinus]MDQ1770657.1 helix-turn-helix transcriptional regulator [Labilibaculum euxinus]MWN75828.1 helix-turn-helix domain-containing protein [Labilibaculum euxinus]
METIIKVNSISQLHEMLNMDVPKNPLITIIDVSDIEVTQEMVDIKVVTDLYCIALKDVHCGMEYGRNSYDFENGALMFTAPLQAFTATKPVGKNENKGWMLFFHPSFLSKSHLSQKMNQYYFFEYHTDEALHLSTSERNTLNDIISNIQKEYTENIDCHSQKVIISNLELLLNYSLRFYERQFKTRNIVHQGIVVKFEKIVNNWIGKNLLAEKGIPTVQDIAEKINLSPNYLSDVLRKEAGISAKDYINNLMIRKAKAMLLSSTNSVSEIAYLLGFNYPHYFTRFFKSKTGATPTEYRRVN